MRFNKKVDKCQAEIVKSLRSCGLQVVITNMGDDYPDVMVGYKGKWILLELKNPKESSLSRGQLQFIVDAKGPVGVATDFAEAMWIVTENKAITQRQQENVIAWMLRNPEQGSLSTTKFKFIIDA